MAIMSAQGRTYEMLLNDKRVKAVRFPIEHMNKVNIELADGWSVAEPHSEVARCLRKNFDNWEAARNWVRKAVQTVDA